MKTLIALLAAFVVAACTGSGGKTYSGLFRQGFEQADFYPDTGGGPWWVTWETEGIAEKFGEFWTGDGRGRSGVMRVTVAGELSAEGQHGHLGAYKRELKVTEIKDIKAATEEEFSAAAKKANPDN